MVPESDLVKDSAALQVLTVFPFIMGISLQSEVHMGQESDLVMELLGLRLLEASRFLMEISMQLDLLPRESDLALRAGTALPALGLFAFMMEM
jgi:hypothetical protein